MKKKGKPITTKKPPPDFLATPMISDLKEALFQITNSMVEQIKITQIKAQLCHVYYTELLNQGFSDQEALELCKSFNF